MPQTAPPPDREPTSGLDRPKREYHAPELRDIGSVTELTQSTGTGTTNDGAGPYFS